MTSFESSSEPHIELATSEHGAYSILDMPVEALPAAERVVAGLKRRAFLVHLLQGEDRPAGMVSPFGVWPHPSPEAIDMIRKETQLPVFTTEELIAQRRAALKTPKAA